MADRARMHSSILYFLILRPGYNNFCFTRTTGEIVGRLAGRQRDRQTKRRRTEGNKGDLTQEFKLPHGSYGSWPGFMWSV